jgi:GAF domain-containing protein
MSTRRSLSAPSKGLWRRLTSSLLSRRAIEIAEGVLGVLAVGLLDYFLPTDLGLQQFDLYLLWVVVLGISARYGAPAGYVVSFLAAATFDLMISVHASPYEAISPHLAIQPFLLFASGILVSELVRAHKREAARAREKLDKANETLRQWQDQYVLTLEAKNELERRIANQPVSIGMMSEFGQRMSALRSHELYPVILELLQSLLDVQACALYIFENGQLRLAVGQPEGFAGRPLSLAEDHPLVQRAVRERHVVTIRDIVQSLGPAARVPGVAVGPLLAGDGQLLGVIFIERMPFFKFTAANTLLFEQVLKWIASALQNAQNVESLAAKAR